MIKCVQIPSKERIKINVSNITSYKPKDFAELLDVSVKHYNVGIDKEL